MKLIKQEVLTRGLDKDIQALSAVHELTKSRPTRGWLRAVREALGLSQKAVAAKAGVTQQSLLRLESREGRGAITLASLERAATAMDCDLVYYLVPKAGMAGSFAELAKRHDPDGAHRRAVAHSMALEGQIVETLNAQDAVDAVVIRGPKPATSQGPKP